MSERMLYKDEIATSILKVANEKKEAEIRDIVVELSDLIENSYNGKSLNVYKGDWKRKIKAAAKAMTYRLLDSNKDCFDTLNFENPECSSTSKSTNSNYKLTKLEKEHVIDLYNSIPTSGNWKLSTGKVVDDQMKKLAEESIYEHPVHSLILDPDDLIWKQYFTVAELNEIRQHRAPQLPNIPDDLKEYLNSYDQKWTTAKELYFFADSLKHDPVHEFDKKWMRESIVRISELFLENDVLELNDFSEADLLHDIWPFLYRAFKNKGTKVSLGERASGAVALARNEHRGLEAREKRSRKAIGAKLDIVFKIGYDEHGSCEVGKNDVTVADDKYLNDGLIKLPKTLRDMMALLVQKNSQKINSLLTVGFLVMGLCMELVVVDIPVGQHITRITKTARFEFPSSIETMATDFLPLLEITWKGKQAMKMAHKTMNDRKRKNTELIANSSDIVPSLAYSFYRKSAAFM
ncbi:hypothetical protein G6F46_011062 [Rhizopus delemar]|uniref:Uncharacterized protein n=2 Tax=Rhizopus TaxID=4842 RepID=A0A9P7CK62_9FUNG|nr:hypothetical protein G6F55_010508 [Rhizopus delemar]KAG1536148.1 hypothetical protein G6F51_011128 [Rhizopus arrhizus]KAG1502312.1 hypothetical protein G6F53_010884 [Rhizopus delemar]KAG1519254.1 hypothetical protein G6F52_008800 [Rhizopus delemar]KAG1543027.1 hypothetical protein G6F49_011459 [Rhizopus delemar]